MGSFSIWHWMVVLLIVLVLFGGRGKISALMGDFGKGLRSFKKGLNEADADEAEAAEPKALEAAKPEPVTAADARKKEKA